MFHDVNWLAVVVAAIAWFIVGSVWYTALFGKAWAKLVGFDEATATGSMPLLYGAALLLEIVASAFLAGLLHLTGSDTWGSGLHLGLLIGVGIVLPVMAINNLFQRNSPMLTVIDAGHMTVGLGLAGLILGAWQ